MAEMVQNTCDKQLLTIRSGNTQLYMSSLSLTPKVNGEGGMELGISWNYAPMLISLIQWTVQVNLQDNTLTSSLFNKTVINLKS